MKTTSRWNLYIPTEFADLTTGDLIFIVRDDKQQTGDHVIFLDTLQGEARYIFPEDQGGAGGGCSMLYGVYKVQTAMTLNATLNKLTVL